MSSEELKPGDVRRAETLIGRIRGVSTCRILLDDGGGIAEVHVVANGGKPPRLVARDVESALKATMGIEVDYRKIGVVVVDDADDDSGGANGAGDEVDGGNPNGQPATGAPAPAATAPADRIEEFPIEEHASRFAFGSVNVLAGREGLRAEVELTLGDAVAFGCSSTPNTTGEAWLSIAEATLRAVSEFLDGDTRLCLGGVRQLDLGDKQAFVVRVDRIGPRGSRSLVGCAFVSGNLNQSVVFATLDAVNRVVGRLDFRNSIEYRIR